MNFEIKTDSGEYVAMFSRYGWTGSVCRICKVKAKSILWFKFYEWEEVWEGKEKNLIGDIKSGKPEWLYAWAKRSVAEYEDYKKAWDDWSEKK